MHNYFVFHLDLTLTNSYCVVEEQILEAGVLEAASTNLILTCMNLISVLC